MGGSYAVFLDGSSAGGFPRRVGDEPQWSPDGQWVVYSTYYSFIFSNTSQIILMQSDGRNSFSLTNMEKDGRSPTWSPDGRTIAYETEGSLYTLDVGCLLDGNLLDECNLTPEFLAKGYAPDWDPTGKKILFISSTYDSSGTRVRFIQSIDVDSAEVETLSPEELNYCYTAKWSPDGEEIVFGCGGGAMYLAKKDGTIIASYVDLGITGGNPIWSLNGNHILFTSVMGDDLAKPINIEGTVVSNALYSMALDGSDLHRLTSRSDENIIWFALMP